MTREIPHRYLQDNDGETYYPRTDMEAVTGLSKDSTIVDINTKIDELNSTVDKVNKAVESANKTIADVDKATGANYYMLQDFVFDSGWKDYAVGNADKNSGIVNGFNCMIREVSIGLFEGKQMKIRTLRVNIGNVPHNVQVGQLPNGFIDETVRFIPSVSSGHIPPTVSVDTQGAMYVFFPSEDRDGKQWVYGQHTWLVN